MGATYLTGLADWLRAAGLAVVEYQGWTTRARSSGGYDSGRPWGVMWHHTASQTSPANDAAYMCSTSGDRPIANLLIARDGTVWVLAAGATNTNGKGGPWRWSKGQVPADDMNRHAVGMELANAGTGVEPFPQLQIDAAFATSGAVLAGLGLDPGDVCVHACWSPGRKIDPAPAAAVEGPWRPAGTNSSGSWSLDDLIAEHRRRASSGFAPGPSPSEDDLTEEQAAQLARVLECAEYVVRTTDGTNATLWGTTADPPYPVSMYGRFEDIVARLERIEQQLG